MEHNDTERFPHDPKLPQGDVLVDMFQRIADMSDALHDPDGLLQVALKAMADKATQRHVEMMAVIGRTLTQVLAISARLDIAEDDIERVDARITLLAPRPDATFAEIQ